MAGSFTVNMCHIIQGFSQKSTRIFRKIVVFLQQNPEKSTI